MPRKKKDLFISESVGGLSDVVNIDNLSIMNGYVLIKPRENGQAEIASIGSINPLRLVIGELVYFDQNKITKIDSSTYALKFDDIVARVEKRQSAKTQSAKTLLLEDDPMQSMIDFVPNIENQEPIQQATPSVNIQEEAVIPAVNPPSYNVTRSFQHKNNQPSSGVKHVDKPIRK